MPTSPPSLAQQRLRDLPWSALEGLAHRLDQPLSDVLAGQAAERVLDRLLRAHRQLGPRERQAVAEAIFGVALWRRRLRAQLGPDEPQAPPLVLLGILLRDLAGLEAASAERLCGQALPPARPSPQALAPRHSLPDWLAAELVQAYASDADAMADTLNLPGPVFLRANTLAQPRAALQASLASDGIETEPTRLAPQGLRVRSHRPNLLGSAASRQAHFEAQDEGSQLLASLLEARPGDSVLDLCAGAGGKSLAIACGLANQGQLHAFDVDRSRLDRLRERARRAGVRCLLVHLELPSDLRVDRVLVDAPCSELGALRRGPDARWRLEPERYGALPGLQRQLLELALRHLRPGGRLVYATCTFRQAENQGVARALEGDHPELRRLRPCAALPDALFEDGFFRVDPLHHGTDAFFAAAWERTPPRTPP